MECVLKLGCLVILVAIQPHVVNPNKLCAWRHNMPPPAVRCSPDAVAQLQPIPYAGGAQRALLPISVSAMNINIVHHNIPTPLQVDL